MQKDLMFKRFGKVVIVFGSLALFAGGMRSSQGLYQLAEDKRALCREVPHDVAEAREMIRKLRAENDAHPAPRRAAILDGWR
jgi:hypothetical protein